MARTIPATFETAAVQIFGKPVLLHELSVLHTPLYITSGEDSLSFNSNTFRAWSVGISGGIGAEVDWRGGLGAIENYKLAIIQDFEDVNGGGSKVPSRLEDLAGVTEFDVSNNKAVRSWVQDGTGGYCDVYMVYDDGTPVVGEAVKVFSGRVVDVSLPGYSSLEVELSPGLDGVLNKTFLNAFGDEGSGDENYISGRDNLAEGQSVPIVYGLVPYAKGYSVHGEATGDDTLDSGLLICFSDSRWETQHSESNPVDEIQLYIPDRGSTRDKLLGSMDEVLQTVSSSLGNISPADGDQYETFYDAGTFPSGESQLETGGAFVRFKHSEITNSLGYMATAGNVIVKRLVPLRSFNYHTPSNDLLGPHNAMNYSTTNYFYIDTDESSGNYGRYIEYQIPQIFYSGKVIRQFLHVKIAHNGGTYKELNATFVSRDGTTEEASLWGNNTTNWHTDASSTGDYNNIDGFDSKREIGCIVINGFRDAREVFGGAVRVGLYDPGLSNTGNYPTDVRFYAAQLEVWNCVPWADLLNQFAGTVYGIWSSTYSQNGSTNLVEVPADVFYHFMAEVLGASGRVDSTQLDTESAAQAADSLKLAFQLTEGNTTAQDVIDRIALQSMSWVFTDSSNQYRMVYRPNLSLSQADAESPINQGDIIEGSFRTRLTDREDLYSGVILNYAYNYVTQEFEQQYRALQTAHRLSSNIPTSTDYVAMLDGLPDDISEPLTVNADMIQDATTAEKLTKWLVQQHSRRRQLFDFDLKGLEFANLEPGDVIALDHPLVMPYSWGTLAIDHSASPYGCTKQAGSKPVDGASNILGMEVPDICWLKIDGSGPNAGQSWLVDAYTDNDEFDVTASGTAPANQSGTPEEFQVLPALAILSAKIVQREDGYAVRVKAVEAPVLRAGATSI